MKHAMEVNGQFLEARSNAARFFHPSDALFDYGALPISGSIKLDSSVVARPFIALVRNDRLDPTGSEPIPNAANAVSFVGGQPVRTGSWAAQALRNGDAVHHRLDLRRFMNLPGRNFDTQRSSEAVSNQVELRPKPASAAAQSVVRRFVGMPAKLFSQRQPPYAHHGRLRHRYTRGPSR